MSKGRVPQKRSRDEDGDDTRISVYTRIPVGLHDRAVDFYLSEDRPISWVIAQALEFYLDEYTATGVPPKLKRRPTPAADPFNAERHVPNARKQTGV